MSSKWYPGIERFCRHWKNAPMLEQTFDAMRRTFEEENDGCIDAAKCMVECACRIIIKNLDDPKNPIRDWKNSPLRGSNQAFKDWVSGTLKLLELTESKDDIFSKVLSQHYKLVDELG